MNNECLIKLKYNCDVIFLNPYYIQLNKYTLWQHNNDNITINIIIVILNN